MNGNIQSYNNVTDQGEEEEVKEKMEKEKQNYVVVSF